MKSKVGLWIDHQKAVIVTITDVGEETHQITSHMENTFALQAAHPKTVRLRTCAIGNLTTISTDYYDDVLTCLREAESILIFGPGEA